MGRQEGRDGKKEGRRQWGSITNRKIYRDVARPGCRCRKGGERGRAEGGGGVASPTAHLSGFLSGGDMNADRGPITLTPYPPPLPAAVYPLYMPIHTYSGTA